MNHVFDLGNSRLKWAQLDAAGRPGPIHVVAHADNAFADDLARVLPRGEVAWLACVAAPTQQAQLLAVLTQHFERIGIARTQAVFDGVRIAYENPERLGVDRFLALLGANARPPGPWLLVGVGTAMTIDLLAADGGHQGGLIAPSPVLMRQALLARAPRLGSSGGRMLDFAQDTDDALASGCEGAAVALVERSLANASTLLGAIPRLLLHGGGADALSVHLPAAVRAPALVLEGLARWATAERDAPSSRWRH